MIRATRKLQYFSWLQRPACMTNNKMAAMTGRSYKVTGNNYLLVAFLVLLTGMIFPLLKLVLLFLVSLDLSSTRAW